MSERTSITYFSSPGTENTQETLQLARQVWDEKDLARVVVASTTGDTAVKALDVFPAERLVIVGHHYGFKEPGESEMDPKKRQLLEQKGAVVQFASHGLSGLGRSLSGRFGGITPPELVAHTLRLLGEGFKVCLEMAIMAADAGLVPVDAESLFIAGTGRGADTAVILQPTHANRWFDMGVPRIICMPAARRRR